MTKQFYLWHWVSSALALVSMLFFAVTGITLNRAGSIAATPEVTVREVTLPPEVLVSLRAAATGEATAIPADAASWFRKELGVRVAGRTVEFGPEELYVSLPRPGGDAWLEADLATGDLLYEETTRGMVAFLNDLHKGRHTGPVWAWFLDLISVATVVVCLTGLVLLWVHSRRRPSTWPVIAAGGLLPLLLIFFFVHR